MADNFDFKNGLFKLNESGDKSIVDSNSIKQLIGLPFGEDGSYVKKFYYDTYNMNNFAAVDMGFGFRKAYVFITSPDCKLPYIAEGASNMTQNSSSAVRTLYNFIQSSDENVSLAKYLAFSKQSNLNPWFFPLMNSLKSISNFPSFTMKTSRSAANMRGNYIEMAVDTKESLSDNSVTLTFEDDRYGTVSKILYMWIEYMDMLRLGLIDGPEAYNFTEGDPSLYDYDILDYICSIFIFITDETGSKIVFPFKLTGCFPKGKSYDYLNFTKPVMKEKNDISVQFSVSIPEDMKLEIYGDFNNINWLVAQQRSAATGSSRVLVERDSDGKVKNAKYINPSSASAEGTLDIDKYNYMNRFYPDKFIIRESTTVKGEFHLIHWNDEVTSTFNKVRTKG